MDSPSCRTYSAIDRIAHDRQLCARPAGRTLPPDGDLLILADAARRQQRERRMWRLLHQHTGRGIIGGHRLRRSRHERVGHALALLLAPAEQQGEQVVVLDGRRLAAHRELLRRGDVVQRVERARRPSPRAGVGEQVDGEPDLPTVKSAGPAGMVGRSARDSAFCGATPAASRRARTPHGVQWPVPGQAGLPCRRPLRARRRQYRCRVLPPALDRAHTRRGWRSVHPRAARRAPIAPTATSSARAAP